MEGFNKYKKFLKDTGAVDSFDSFKAFIAGQQSKQAEVDELLKRIDDLDKQLFVQKGLNRFLKGKSNEH